MNELIITIVCALVALAALNLCIRTKNWRRWTYLANAVGFGILAWAALLAPPWSVIGVGLVLVGEGVGTLAKWIDFEFFVHRSRPL